MKNVNQKPCPIAVFDSGAGGLSVLRAIWKKLPSVSFIYLADQAHVPYGSRSLQEVRSFSDQITERLLELGARLIVVACNTASAAALRYLREIYPQVPFVGMEPAVKPAAECTESGVVGVLATPATFQGELYASVVERFGNQIEIFQDTCPGLVHQIESGNLDSPQIETILRKALDPMLEKGVDTVVLGCTHYPFIIPMIEEIVGEQVTVIDPAPAVARQVYRLFRSYNLLEGINPRKREVLSEIPATDFYTTGSADRFADIIRQYLQVDTPVQKAYWQEHTLIIPGCNE